MPSKITSNYPSVSMSNHLCRLEYLLQGNGIGIVDAKSCFGGGSLTKYIINSNTRGASVLKAIYKPAPKESEKKNDGKTEISSGKSGVSSSVARSSFIATGQNKDVSLSTITAVHKN
jgi:hypothetical protein